MKKIIKTIVPVSKVVLSYLLAAVLWILFSDQLVDAIVAGTRQITEFQTYKGLFFVSVTAILLQILMSRVIYSLEQNRDQLQKIMDQSPGMICTIEENGRFVQVSKAAKGILGYTPKELVNKKFLDFVHPEDYERTTKVAIEVIKGDEIRGFTNRYIQKDGEVVHLEWSAIWDDEARLLHAIAIDVTAVKEAENETAKERNMLRSIIDNIPHYIYIKDNQRKFILNNQFLNKELFNTKTTDEAIGKTAYDLFEGEVAKPIDEDDKRVIETGKAIINREESGLDFMGNETRLLTTKVPLKNQDGQIYGLVGISRDVTEIEKTRDQIKQAKERYEMVMKATKDIIFDWDIVNDSIIWGQNYERYLGNNDKNKDFDLNQWVEKIHPEERGQIYKSLIKVLSSTESEWQAEYRFKKNEASYVAIRERSHIIRDEKGKAIRMVGALEDISLLKQKEEKVQNSLKEKEVLLNEIHHRVKNNLAVISGMMQLQALDEENSLVKAKFLDNVARIQSMAYIHEHLYESDSFSDLDFSANLKKLIKSIADTFPSEAHIALEFDIVPVQLNVNQAMPASLIVNEVITNILKYAFNNRAEGKIISELSQVGEQIKLTVSDTGTGLPANFGEKRTLGLQLIDELSKQLGGDYEYKSSANGTTFSLSFEKSDCKGISNASL